MTWLRLNLGLVVSLAIFAGVLPTVLAASSGSDVFILRATVDGDTTPPTIPGDAIAIPVATSQIDLTWSPATDNYYLAGYRVWRDGVQIATTTMTSFSDTGLNSDTLYSYTLDAFDELYNFSSSTDPFATTTLAISSISTTTIEKKGTANNVLKQPGVMVTPTWNMATIRWKTNLPTQYIVRWGRTTAYELGSLSSALFQLTHVTTIAQLEPGTRYVYELVAITGVGFTKVISQGSFVTESVFITSIPPNVSRFTADARQNGDVHLSWQNPALREFSHVRVLRSPLFYPQNQYDGNLVYDGPSTTVIDHGALTDQSPQYYTIFVYNQSGMISSGAVDRATKIDPGLTPLTPSSTSTLTLTTPPIPPEQERGDAAILSAAAVIISQGDREQTLNDAITLVDTLPYTVSIFVPSVPPHLKSIIITVQNPSDQRLTSSFLLKINPAGDRYEAVLPPVMIEGQSRVTLEVVDYQAQTIRRVSNTITYVADAPAAIPFPDRFFYWWWTVPASILSLIVMVALVRWIRAYRAV